MWITFHKRHYLIIIPEYSETLTFYQYDEYILSSWKLKNIIAYCEKYYETFIYFKAIAL